jgi:hypothetical protein
MACKREARARHNTIAFWLSDDEKRRVDARIIISGLPKGEYYRKAVLGEEIHIVAGRYRSDRLAMALERLYDRLKGGDADGLEELRVILHELLELIKK